MAKKKVKRVKARPPTKPARKKKAPVKKIVRAVKPVKRAAVAPAARRASSWLDEESNKPLIEKHARKLGTFVEALADGKVDEAEVQAQEKRLVKAMRDVESDLNPAQHAKVTRLLCELTAYDLMNILHAMAIEASMPKPGTWRP